MTTTSHLDVTVVRTTATAAPDDRRLPLWGGRAAVAGVVAMVGAFVVVFAFGLPDASDPETLTDFADLRTGRLLEHLCYLAALVLFALHALVLHRLLTAAHSAAALFGTALVEMGYLVMMASSVLHVSTRALADRYEAADATVQDQHAVESAWAAAQSVFDTMLLTGALLVPVGFVLLGIAMRHTRAFGSRLADVAIGLGALGTLGALAEIVDDGLELVAISVLTMIVFHGVTGWRTLQLGAREPGAGIEPTTT